MEQNTTVELRCSVMQVRFHRDNYSVCLCKTPDQIPEDAVRNTLELTGENTFIAVGYGLPTQVGKEVKVSGIWTFNKKYETTQLEVRDCADYVGGGHDAIVEYLSSGILNSCCFFRAGTNLKCSIKSVLSDLCACIFLVQGRSRSRPSIKEVQDED